MLYIYEGCGEIEVNGVCYKASKGDLFSYILDVASVKHFDYGEIHKIIKFHDFEGFKPYTKVYNCSEAEKRSISFKVV